MHWHTNLEHLIIRLVHWHNNCRDPARRGAFTYGVSHGHFDAAQDLAEYGSMLGVIVVLVLAG